MLALFVLASRGYHFDGEPVLTILMALVAILTLLSIVFYVGEWVRHMNAADTRQ